MTRKPLAEVPYSTVTGDMEAYPGRHSEWRPNTPFAATMHIVDMHRGRSAARFVAEDENGTEYPMFMSELLAIVQKHTIVEGTVQGRWIGCKRGENYGIRLISQEPQTGATMSNILDLPMRENDADAATIREYLLILLKTLVAEMDSFSGKKPFGNSGWIFELYDALACARVVEAAFDEEGDLTDLDRDAAEMLIAEAIDALLIEDMAAMGEVR
ncbi:hypothetical protein OG563_26835 [Nocardia vinacea]|uniref:Uncharacterized protein n=1 Tax=Nocardia vinacea TaxID=96468 RepID=A0ABZ1YI92_9NOCA|nr:hypothetical protein [Nocardia vinacea]